MRRSNRRRKRIKGIPFVMLYRKKMPKVIRQQAYSYISTSPVKRPEFSLGVGFGVLYLLVSSWKEFERLNKLLEQTEMLVQDMKQQFQCGRNMFSVSLPKSGSPGIYLTDLTSTRNEDQQCSKLQQ
eukprot:c332_g1_i1 orf=268-645(+)